MKLSLREHIDKNYGGSVHRFAKSNEYKSAKSVYAMLDAKHPHYVIDGELVQIKRKIK